MSVAVSVKPQREPISLDEIKDHLHIETSDHDSELIGLMKESRDYVERVTGRSMITQTLVWRQDGLSSSMKVPRPPLQSVTSIQYQDSSNATQTLSSASYVVDTSSEPGRIEQAYNASYPDTYPSLDAVSVTYVAGYGDDPDDVPELFKRAMKLYIEKMFDNPTAAYASALDKSLEMMLFHDRVDNLAL